MPTSKTHKATLAEYELTLLWGAWVELGVSGWQRTHSNWAIDPEPLIVRTATLGDADPRLRDEALDWCIHNWRYVSRVRLRNLLREQAGEAGEAWGRFAATVNTHSKVRWPNATQAIRYVATGRSSLDSMEQPSRAWIRLRAMFGLGARTEILRYFLSGQRRATVATIAENVGYTKRNVADECDSLEKAGVLKMRQLGNRFYYTLGRATELRDFAGAIAPIQPAWTSLLEVTSTFVALEAAAETLAADALMVEAHRVTRLLDDKLDALGIQERPRLVQRDDYWPAVRNFARKYMSSWSAGKWVPNGEQIKLSS
jgi:DNA-binding transcriptional ArsR family regulator